MIRYILFSIIIHHGDSLLEGHYSAFICINNIFFNDEIVSEVSEKKMKVISKGYMNSSAVMAIYIDSSKYDDIIHQTNNDD